MRIALALLLLGRVCLAAPVPEVNAALTDAEHAWQEGQTRASLKGLARALKAAQDAGDHALALAVAQRGALMARRLGANDQADLYVQVAQGEAQSEPVRAQAIALAQAQVKAARRPPPPPEPYEAPLGIYSYRSSMARFRARVKDDPEYLAGLTRLKSFRDDPATTIVGTLEEPGVHVDPHRFFKDDYKTVSEALGYYKFVLKLSNTLDDRFGLAVLYVNLTVLRTNDHPALQWLYGLTKTAAIVEASSRIFRMATSGTSMGLTILALDKSVIDVIRHFEHDARPSSELLMDDDGEP